MQFWDSAADRLASRFALWLVSEGQLATLVLLIMNVLQTPDDGPVLLDAGPFSLAAVPRRPGAHHYDASSSGRDRPWSDLRR